MKKFFVASIVGLSSLGFIACSSDDDSTPTNNDPMVGSWKATDLTYTVPVIGTHTVPFSATTDGCDVDELELKANNTIDLERESKVNEVCTETHTGGSWNATTVTVEGETEPREVVSATPNAIELKYEMTFGTYGTTYVTVKYVRS